MLKFILYDGAYPNLCSGTLVVEIDGEKISFGQTFLWESEKAAGVQPANYPKFWTSGGSVSFDDEWNESVMKGDWQLDFNKKDYPAGIVALMPELIKMFNENVRNGCCGGCV